MLLLLLIQIQEPEEETVLCFMYSGPEIKALFMWRNLPCWRDVSLYNVVSLFTDGCIA